MINYRAFTVSLSATQIGEKSMQKLTSEEQKLPAAGSSRRGANNLPLHVPHSHSSAVADNVISAHLHIHIFSLCLYHCHHHTSPLICLGLCTLTVQNWQQYATTLVFTVPSRCILIVVSILVLILTTNILLETHFYL